MKVAIVASKAYIGQAQEDVWVRDALKGLGVEAECAAWDDEGQDWARFQRVVLRSAWGYQHSLGAFERWMERMGARLVNPIETVRGNIYKHEQFAQMRGAGLPMIPTSMISAVGVAHTRLPAGTLRETLARDFGGSEGLFVMKPIVSASGNSTLLVDFSGRCGRPNCVSEEAERIFSEMLEATERVGVILQPFVPQIDGGEYALMYFGGRFSHGALRFPAIFRKERGMLPVRVPAHVLALGERVMASLPEPAPVYGRVDVVDTPEGPLLMELELCEPHLFFGVLEQGERETALKMLAEAILFGLHGR